MLDVEHKEKEEGGRRVKGELTEPFSSKPLVSIITVVYNGEKYLEETIKSVINQTYDNVEYIIIDGDSTDGTVEIIEKYEEQIDYWVSERDEGIYDAMNKGLQVVRGKYIGILNADDYYKKYAIEFSLENIFSTKSDYSIANVEYVNGRMIRAIYPLKEEYIYQEMPYPHVSAFISSEVYKKVGLFNTLYKIAGDHDMSIRIHLEGFKCCYTNKVIATLEEGGISSSLESNRESLQVAINNGKNRINALFTYILQITKVSIAKLLPSTFVTAVQKLKNSRFQ